MWLANTISSLSSPSTSATATPSAPLVGTLVGEGWKVPPVSPQYTLEKTSAKPPEMLLANTRSVKPFLSMSPTATSRAPLVGRL